MTVLPSHDGLISPLTCYTHLLSSFSNVELPLSQEDANVHLICTSVHPLQSCYGFVCYAFRHAPRLVLL